MEVRNKQLTEDEFLKERQAVLAQWPTGRDVNLDEAVEYHRNMPPGKNLARKLVEAEKTGKIYSITGMGKPTLEQQVELWKYVEEEGQAEILGTSVDSFSRVGDFKAAEDALRESAKANRSLLNGVPVVNHGVAKMRKAIEAVNVPVQMRYGSVDIRLIDEVGLAAGHTGTSGEALYNFWNMNSKLSLATIIRTHQYIHRLAAYYEEHGVPIMLSVQGLYAGGAAPPSLVIAAVLTGVLTMAGQGAKHINLHHQTKGNLVQDVASADILRRLAREYLDKSGHTDVKLLMSSGLCLLQYPAEIGPAFAVMTLSTIGAILCGAQLNDIRTISEAVTIPTKEETATTLKFAKVLIDLLKNQKIEIGAKVLKPEVQIQEQETTLILDKVLDMGDGDVVTGTIRAVESGVLDNPFSTSPAVKCQIMGVKDSEGAVRYLNHGNLPFTKEIIEFNKEKLAEREKRRGQKLDYETVIHDLLSISKGKLTG